MEKDNDIQKKSNLKIILVHPPQPNSIDDRLNPPLGLLYIAAVLEKNHYNVSIVDLAGIHETDQWYKIIPKADIYGFTCYSAQLHIVKELARISKQKNPKCITVVGGAHPSAMPEETSKIREFDIICKGEGEYAMLNFIKKYEETGSYDKIISHPRIKNLDELPFPARHLVDLNSYSRTVDGKRAINIITSRGCPYNCSFCYKGIFGSKVVQRSAENVLEEVKQLKKQGYTNFVFWDDIFTLNRERLYKILDGFKELGVTFRCNGRVGVNTYQDFVKLAESGCREIAFGIESGSQKILNKMGKNVTLAQNKKAIQEAKKAGLITRVYLMVGFPGETKATIEETKNFILDSQPDQTIMFSFVPLVGSDVWANPEKYNIKIFNSDLKEQYTIAGVGFGGLMHETNETSKEELLILREELLQFLRHNHKQRGKLQPYYEKFKGTEYEQEVGEDNKD